MLIVFVVSRKYQWFGRDVLETSIRPLGTADVSLALSTDKDFRKCRGSNWVRYHSNADKGQVKLKQVSEDVEYTFR